MDRRYFLGLAGLGSVIGVGGLLASKSSVGQKSGEKALGVAAPSVVEIALKATEAEVPIYRGWPTQVWQFQGTLLKGDPSCLQASEGSYLGPTVRVRRGQKLRVRFTNDLHEPTVVHWHGLHVLDGHPSNTVVPGQTFVYEFVIKNRAGTYWYHAHPADRTGPQVYYGLAGLLIVSDDEEAAKQSVFPSCDGDDDGQCCRRQWSSALYPDSPSDRSLSGKAPPSCPALPNYAVSCLGFG